MRSRAHSGPGPTGRSQWRQVAQEHRLRAAALLERLKESLGLDDRALTSVFCAAVSRGGAPGARSAAVAEMKRRLKDLSSLLDESLKDHRRFHRNFAVGPPECDGVQCHVATQSRGPASVVAAHGAFCRALRLQTLSFGLVTGAAKQRASNAFPRQPGLEKKGGVIEAFRSAKLTHREIAFLFVFQRAALRNKGRVRLPLNAEVLEKEHDAVRQAHYDWRRNQAGLDPAV